MLLESASPRHIHIYCIYGVKHIGYLFFILFATTRTDLAKVCISLTVSEIHMGLMQCCLWRVQHHPQTPLSSGIPCLGIPAMSHCAAVSYLCIAWPRWDHQYFIICRIPACHCCLYTITVMYEDKWSIAKLVVQLNELRQSPRQLQPEPDPRQT